MAKLKATPHTYSEAAAVLNGRDSVKLGNNTWLERIVTDRLKIVVRLHSTNIVVFHDDGRVTLHTGGYRTVTTKDRLNQFITGRVYQKAHQWYYVRHRLGLEQNFAEGMEVQPFPETPRLDLTRTCECGAPYDNDLKGFTCAD
jgi:hypothetical protein